MFLDKARPFFAEELNGFLCASSLVCSLQAAALVEERKNRLDTFNAQHPEPEVRRLEVLFECGRAGLEVKMPVHMQAGVSQAAHPDYFDRSGAY